MHMLDNDGGAHPLPAEGDPHGWTVIYQTIACDHVHRVIGWVGNKRLATIVSATTAALWHPVLRATPAPAPTGGDTGRINVITEVPEGVRERIHAGEKLTPADLAAAGCESEELIDEVMPEVVMIAARLVELLEAKGVDVAAVLVDSGMHNGMPALVRAGGREVFEKIMVEFPQRGNMTLGTGH